MDECKDVGKSDLFLGVEAGAKVNPLSELWPISLLYDVPVKLDAQRYHREQDFGASVAR